MKFLKKILCMLMILLAVIACFRYIVKEKFFPYKYQEYVDKYSKEYSLDPLFVLSVIKTESKFDDDAQSHKNAVGLMQITAETGEWAAEQMGYSSFSKDDLYDEEYNIKMGCWYLKKLNEKFNGNLDLTIASYNAGPTNVQSWLANKEYSTDGVNLNYIPFGETKKYVDKVNAYYNVYKYFYGNNESYFDTNKIIDIIKSLYNAHFV